MSIFFRPAVAADLPSIHEVYNEALNDMIRRAGGTPPEAPDTTCYVFPQRAYPDLFFVADERGRVVAFANALLNDGIWFLSGFWCRPSHQGKGIARRALEMCWEAGRRAGAHTFCVFSSSAPPAMGNYMRMGMMPCAPFISLALTPEQARAADVDPASVTPAPVGESSVTALGAVDAIVRGARRPAEHRFWLEDPERTCLTVVDQDQVVAYAYVHRPTGRIGPAAWLQRLHGPPLLEAAVRTALQAAGKAHCRPAGANHDAIRYLLSRGFRVKGYGHFMTTAPFGRFEQYCMSERALL